MSALQIPAMEICPTPTKGVAVGLKLGRHPTRTSIQVAPPSPFRRIHALAAVAASCNSSHHHQHHSGGLEIEESPNRMFILGMGFVGKYFATELENQGWIVSGTCTCNAKKKKLEEMGFNASVFDANNPETEILSHLSHYTHLLVSIPPVVGIGDPLLQHKDLLNNELGDGNLRWLCYLSSTSVYGDCGGALVDEDYQVNPTSELAQARLAAEEGWLEFGRNLGLPVQIFRLGGIYGPGRSAVNTVIKQEPMSEVQRMRWSKNCTSRVHVADICQAINASIYKPSQGKIYNVVDDDPASRVEVFAFARELVERKWPGQMKQSTSPDQMESYILKKNLMGEKLVSNARLKRELGVRLIHPSYKSGLLSVIEQIDNPIHRYLSS